MIEWLAMPCDTHLVPLDYNHYSVRIRSRSYHKIRTLLDCHRCNWAASVNGIELINGPNFYNSLLANESWVIANINLRCLCSEKWRLNITIVNFNAVRFHAWNPDFRSANFKAFITAIHVCVALFGEESDFRTTAQERLMANRLRAFAKGCEMLTNLDSSS